MSFNLASGQSGALLIRSHPLGIGEGFEPSKKQMVLSTCVRLNPLGIGEGFEPQSALRNALKSLNPLGIGESFELSHLTYHN